MRCGTGRRGAVRGRPQAWPGWGAAQGPGAGGHRGGGPGGPAGARVLSRARPAAPPIGQSVNEAGAFTPPVCLVLSRRSYSEGNSQRNTNHHIPPGVVSLAPANYPEGQRKVFYREKARTRLPGGPDPWEAHSRQAPGRTPGPCPWCRPSRPPAFWKRHRDPRFWPRTPPRLASGSCVSTPCPGRTEACPELSGSVLLPRPRPASGQACVAERPCARLARPA